ncbi:unnamed protein product [Effrenium voratum]|nr:unnamed protein product [Effrenium voratum]
MYRLQTQWVNCCTQTSYLASLATWTDGAKDYYFNTKMHGVVDGGGDHPFQLGDAPWVIRTHSFIFRESRRYHSCTDYRSDLAISTSVTRVGRTSMDLEHGIYHDLGGTRKLLCEVASSIIVFSPETGKPVSHGMEQHAKDCGATTVQLSKDLPEAVPEGAFEFALKPRFADLDGHGHVNNAVLISYLQDARHGAACARSGAKYEKLEDLEAMYVEFLAMAGLEDEICVQLWPSSGSLFFRMSSKGRIILRARMDLGTRAAARLRPLPTLGAPLGALETPAARTLQGTLASIIAKRRDRGLLRKLTLRGGVDFCSNDYLGFARSKELARDIDLELARVSEGNVGSTGSRLLSGNSEYCEALEKELAAFHGAEASLIFNSGFDLNLGFFACVPQVGDLIFFDELIHQSVREGLKLSRGESRQFPHNDVEALRAQIAQAQAEREPGSFNIIVAVESVYSMDGHLAPLAELCDLVEEVGPGACLVVDEAHGTGVYGHEGRGLVSELGLEHRVFCRVHTFGKAMGCHGAAALGPQVLREYLINYAWPLVYSTSLPLHSLVAIRMAYGFLRTEAAWRQRQLRVLIEAFQRRLQKLPKERVLHSPSPIQGVIVPGNLQCVKMANDLRGVFDVLPIRSPTVPAGKERLRIILHAHNTEDQVHSLMDALEQHIGDSPAVAEAGALPSARL